jgi:hypothetical protein
MAQVLPATDGPPIFAGDLLNHSNAFAPRPAPTTPVVAETTPVRWLGVTDHYQHVRLTSLTPGTTYHYRVGDGETWSAWHQCSGWPRPNRRGSLTSTSGTCRITSTGTSPRTLRAAVVNAPHARFMTLAGDLTLSSGNHCSWGEWFAGNSRAMAMIPQLPSPATATIAGSETPAAWITACSSRGSARTSRFPTAA